MMKRNLYRIFGRVQSVGFRYTAYNAAKKTGCTGSVRNEADGSVTLELQGSDEQFERFFVQLEKTNSLIRIDRMDVTEIDVRPDERDFSASRGS